MSRFGDVYENRVTGEHAVILRGSEDAAGGPAVVHLVARPGARVIGEHVHPGFAERFRVIRGRLTTRIAGEERALGPGEQGDVPAGVRHDRWNASSTEEAHVIVEIFPPEPRFELLIGTLFGLANDGQVNAKGLPKPLQAIVIAEEFDDVIRFTRPPRLVQRALVALLAPVARRRGYRAVHDRYSRPQGRTMPDADAVAAAGLGASG